VAIALLSSRAGAWADRNGPRTPVSLGLMAMTMGSAVMAWFAGGSVWGLGTGLTLFGIGYALAQSPLVSTVNRILPRAQAGAGVGVFMMIFFVGGAAGVAACVTISDMYGADQAALFGLIPAPGARFSVALLMLGALTLLAQIPARMLPGESKAQKNEESS
jgi:MFS family permease